MRANHNGASAPKHRMRILQVLPALNQGGVEYCVLENSAHIVTYGSSFVISSGGRLVASLTDHGATHYTLPIAAKSLVTLGQIKALRGLIVEINPDIIHIHSRLQAWLCFFAMRKMVNRPKVLTNVHGFNSVNSYSKKMLFGDRVLLVSHALKNYVMHHYPDVRSDKMCVIPLGVDVQQYHSAVPTSAIIKTRLNGLSPAFDKAKILLLPGRVTRIKGHKYLINLMGRLKDSHPNVLGLIVGAVDPRDQHYVVELKALIKRQGLEAQVFFYGSCDEMPALYRAVSCTLSLTTKPESYGRTVLESLACGTPVLGFDYGGVAENLTKFFPEGKIPPCDEEALYRQTKMLLESSCPSIGQITDTLEIGQRKLKALYTDLIAP